jgi:hypothetical protein
MEFYSVELVRQARVAIWRLFDAELLDDDLATSALLTIAIGYRRHQAGTDGTPRSTS